MDLKMDRQTLLDLSTVCYQVHEQVLRNYFTPFQTCSHPSVLSSIGHMGLRWEESSSQSLAKFGSQKKRREVHSHCAAAVLAVL